MRRLCLRPSVPLLCWGGDQVRRLRKCDALCVGPFVPPSALAPSLGQNLSGGRCFLPARAVSPASSRLREGGDGPAVIAGIRA